jgi:hypothetical protein
MCRVKDYFMIHKGNTHFVGYSDDSDADWAGSTSRWKVHFMVLFPYWRKFDLMVEQETDSCKV